MKKLFRRAFGGGGNRSEARDIVREAIKVVDAKTQRGIEAKSVSGEVTKLLGHYGTKVVSEIEDVKALRRQDDKSVTGIVVLVDSSDEHESIVGWAFQPNNETDLDAKM